MSFSDALTRIADIQQQITALTSGMAVASATSASASGGTSAATSGASPTQSSGSSSSASASQFAAALEEAELSGGSAGTDSLLGSSDDASGSSSVGSLLGGSSTTSSLGSLLGGTSAESATSDLSSLLGASSAGSSADSLLSELLAAESGSQSTATASASTSTTSSATGGSAVLPASASSLLTSGQQQFASTLVADTGLNPSVVTSWLLAEESGSAAEGRQSANNNNWLNVGYTDSGTAGASDAVWSDPTSAATATAQWLKGQDSIPGYGTASSQIQSILSTVGSSPDAQISALQNSGWASSGYPDLQSLYAQVSA